MRKPLYSKTLTLLLTLAVVVGLITLSVGGAFAGKAAAQPSSSSAADILNQAITTTGTMASGSGDFTINATIDADPATLPAAAQVILNQPLTLTGSYGFDANAGAVQITGNAGVAGQTVPLGLIAVNGQAWVQFMGTWYETASAFSIAGDTSGAGGAATSGMMSQADMADILQALALSNIDPSTWISNLTLVGQENVGSGTAYHLSGAVDVNKMLVDVWSLLPSGMMSGTGGSMMESKGGLQDAQATVSNWLKSLTVDLWVDTSTYMFKQFQMNASVVPPAGQGNGINSVTVQAMATLNPATTPMTVTPPTDARPFSDLENTFNSLLNLVSGGAGQGTTPNTGTTGTTPTTATTPTPDMTPSTGMTPSTVGSWHSGGTMNGLHWWED